MKPSNTLRYYHWRGVNQAGRKLSGVIVGYQEQEAREKLLEQKIQIKKIKRRAPSAFTKAKNQMKSADVTAVTRQLATMIQSGVPVVQSIKLISDSHQKSEVRAILSQVNKQVEAGASLSKALRTSSPLFDNFYCDLVATGEETGHLGQVFERLASYREKHEAMRKKVIKAMIYPAMVTLTAIGVTVLMLVFVIPQFANIFSSFGAQLPWFTRQVIKLSNLLINNGLMVTLALLSLIVIHIATYRKSPRYRLALSRYSLKMPILGSVFLKATIARFSRTLATTFTAGIPLLTGLQSAGRTAGNLHIQQAIEQAHIAAAAGMPLYLSLRQCNEFPELMLQMVMIGEESGSLDDMLNKIANLYENDVDNTVDNLGKIIEPLIIVFLGLVIGGLLVAMYMPIFTLMSVMG
ncbi:type II secretion system protein F [Photobacterium jeanii]|uniref:Type II secretion system protein F n=1 Tax=Photobacterium jeanii TaxID=858640 RepID=A0A178KIL4_9GAMM|nr:type II secretion system F family protein [Photobacterium jeanii]OAN16584.1 type II secretion system protein F [Photobacterium jeanii]PST87977.1 type II secretion system F family protein [Photobacterium jeanii]